MTKLLQYYRNLKVNIGLLVLLIVLLSLAVYSYLATQLTSPVRLIGLTISFALLALMALFDFKLHLIPNHLLTINLVTSSALIIWQANSAGLPLLKIWFYHLVVGLGWGLFFLLVKLLKVGLGAGDIKLFFVIGYSFGFKTSLNIIFYSFLVAAVYLIFTMLTKHTSFKQQLPLAPFVFIGFIMMLFINL